MLTSSVLDTGHWAKKYFNEVVPRMKMTDEEVVFPLDWHVVFEYKCVAICVHCY